MTFLDKITGNDIRKEFNNFEDRSKKLPVDYQDAWEKIKANLWQHSDFTGRNLIPIMDTALVLLEELVANGQSVQDTLGDDIKGFSLSLIWEEFSNSFRNKWRKQLNNNIAKKLSKLGE